MNITAKSKTFLVGEYGITCGGNAIILLTPPEFVLSIKTAADSASEVSGINPNSPAFKFYKKHSDVFKNLSLNFSDPHYHSGGFGASSAQFVTLYKLYKQLISENSAVSLSEAVLSPGFVSDFLTEYREITSFYSSDVTEAQSAAASFSSSIKPSGADCVAQFLNEHTYFDSSTNYVEKLSWNFHDIAFFIVKTQHKLTTYSHLQCVSKDFINANISELRKITDGVKKSWINGNSGEFIKGITNFSNKLCDMKLVCQETQELLLKIMRIDGVLAAKGCGAMGMDTIIVIVNRKLIKKVEKKLEKDIANKNIFREY